MTTPSESSDTHPRRRWWPWIVLSVFVLVFTACSLIAYRNQQQWSKATRFVRQLERSGGEGSIFAYYGTDFYRIGDSWVKSRFKEVGWQRTASWPVVQLVHLHRSQKPINIDWHLLSVLEVPSLAIHNPQFSDADLESFPNKNTLEALHLNSPLITNGCLQKIEQFTSLSELSTHRSSIDGTALLKFVQKTNILVAPRLTTTDLMAFNKAGLSDRIGYLEIVANQDFDTSLLKGLPRGGWIVFRGTYGAKSFEGLDAGPVRPYIAFNQAELSVESLSDIASVSFLRELEFTDCKIHGTITSTSPPRPNTEKLKLVLNNTDFPPALLLVLGGRPMVLECSGEFDDAWLEEVIKIPGIEEIELRGTKISEAKAVQYAQRSPSAEKQISHPIVRDLGPRRRRPE